MYLIYSDRLSYPNGYAATHYVHLIGKGLVEAGASCLLLIPRFTEDRDKPLNRASKGNVDGIEFEYTTGTPLRPTNFVNWRLGELRSNIFVQLRIIERFLRKRLDVVILYSGSIKAFRQVYYTCRLLRIPVILCTTEWQPGFTDYDEELIKQYREFYSRALKGCDGFVVISQFLKDVIQEERQKIQMRASILIVPILVDARKWSGILPYHHTRPYFVFCAYLVDYLKEALFVLTAFAGASLCTHDLVILGKSNEKTTRAILLESDRLGITNQLILKVDFIDEPELLALYSGAVALLLPLWDDDRSKARFPFKLGDYLMSGRPVVASGVGEVGKYLKNEETAFIARSDDVEDFSSRIKDAALGNQSGRIGIGGRSVALENFDYRKHGKRMFDFFQTVIESKK